MRRLLLLLLFASPAFGAALPGFRLQLVGTTSGFLSSVVADSKGTLYYTTTKGDLFRIGTADQNSGQPVLVAHVNTDPIGNSGLLGMALRDDRTAVVHYTTPSQIADVIANIDLVTGEETIVASLFGDVEVPQRGAPSEHHGGNPTVAADGSVFVGIGDYGVGVIAQIEGWNGGKVFRIMPDGTVTQFARGVRNPFDMAWDAAKRRLIIPDNGDQRDDEINIAHEGDNLGWPFTMGAAGPFIDNTVRPIYTFPTIVAPTGFTALSGRNPMLRRGYLLGTFMMSLLYIPDIDAQPLPDPIAIFSGDAGFVIDVTEARDGTVYVGASNAIYRLVVPKAGDCNGDGFVNLGDYETLRGAVLDPTTNNAVRTTDERALSWGCDVNADGTIDARDTAALAAMLHLRFRTVR